VKCIEGIDRGQFKVGPPYVLFTFRYKICHGFNFYILKNKKPFEKRDYLQYQVPIYIHM
jgi:hypothetical protein